MSNSEDIINKVKNDFMNEEDKNNNYNTTTINRKNNNIKQYYFDDYFIPYKSPYGEELFLIKNGNILINKSQKELLKEYLKYYFTTSKEYKTEQTLKSSYLRKVINYNNYKRKQILSSLYKNKRIKINNNNKESNSFNT